MATQSTKDYAMFKFRVDNREKGISRPHVEKLKRSISSRNMLELKPIIVNSDFEIIDGQHRCVAAQELRVPIWYTIDKNFKITDMIELSVHKNWTLSDILHNHVCNGNDEYKKLKEFTLKNNIPLRAALNICGGTKDPEKFRKGNFKFDIKPDNQIVFIANQTIDLIKRLNGKSQYCSSTKFWSSLILLIKEPNFNHDIWFDNIKKLNHRICIKPTKAEYVKTFIEIYNYRNSAKIDINKIPEE